VNCVVEPVGPRLAVVGVIETDVSLYSEKTPQLKSNVPTAITDNEDRIRRTVIVRS
jgi:hypothetical protein